MASLSIMTPAIAQAFQDAEDRWHHSLALDQKAMQRQANGFSKPTDNDRIRFDSPRCAHFSGRADGGRR